MLTNLATIPITALTTLASVLVQIRPLGWYPGWRFAAGESELGWIGRQRLRLWHYFERAQLQVPCRIRWYDKIKLEIYLGNDLSRCLYVGGAYEPNEFMFLSRVLQPGMTFIDVGANDGLYSLFASRRVGPAGKVFAFEPSPREYDRLIKNISLNRLTNVVPLQTAASDRAGTATLRIAGFGHEGQNTLGNFSYEITGKGTEHVSITTLDEVVRASRIEQVDVIKMDVEGGELTALRGGAALIERFRPLILLELLEIALQHQGANRQSVIKFLQERDYSFLFFGPSGRPVSVAQVELDGVNIIAVPRERACLIVKAII